jgi:methionine aminopeptidase
VGAEITTEELDVKVHDYIIERGAYPSPLGYSSFPKSCTTSVNNVIAREWVWCGWVNSRSCD